MTDVEEKRYGGLALGLSLGGVVLAATILVFGLPVGMFPPGEKGIFLMLLTCGAVLVAFQLAALVLGIFAWRELLGKVACIISGILAAGALLTLFGLLA